MQGGEGGVVSALGGGGFELDHGAFHALSGGKGEDGSVEGDVVVGGAEEQVGDVVGVEGVGLDGAAEAGVDGEGGGECEGGRRGSCRIR